MQLVLSTEIKRDYGILCIFSQIRYLGFPGDIHEAYIQLTRSERRMAHWIPFSVGFHTAKFPHLNFNFYANLAHSYLSHIQLCLFHLQVLLFILCNQSGRVFQTKYNFIQNKGYEKKKGVRSPQESYQLLRTSDLELLQILVLWNFNTYSGPLIIRQPMNSFK